MSSLKNHLLDSGKVKTSEEWDATYDELPVVIAEDANSLGQALETVSYTHLTLPTRTVV